MKEVYETVSFGRFKKQVVPSLIVDGDYFKHIFSSDLFEQMGLQEGFDIKLHRRFYPDKQTIEYGPTLGLLNHIYYDQFGNIHIKGSQTYAKQIAVQGLNSGVFVCFIDTDQQDERLMDIDMVKAYVRLTDSSFIETIVPIPSYIYDRNIYTTDESKRRQLLEKATNLFLPEKARQIADDKLLFAQILGSSELREYIPNTESLNRSSYEKFRNRARLIIKPRHGKQSVGIFVVNRTPNGLSVSYTKKNRDGDFDRFEEVVAEYNTLLKLINIKGETDEYLIQDYIPYVGYDFIDENGINRRRKVELRVFTNRTDLNMVDISGNILRLHDPLMTGREFFFQPEHVLPILFPNKFEAIVTEAQELAVKTHYLIEEYCRSNLCHLGIDFAITEEGKLVILEANSKPASVQLFHRIGDTKTQLDITQQVLNYAINIFEKE